MNKKEFLELKEPSDVLCTKCAKPMTKGRVLYSKSTKCIDCSETMKVEAVHEINGKTGNTIQIVPAGTSASFNRLQNRKGGIVSAGVKGTGGFTR